MKNDGGNSASDDIEDDDPLDPACVVAFNANDPSGAGGLSADVTAIASVGAHSLTVVTSTYVRQAADVTALFAFDDEAVDEQARAVLEDTPAQVIKLGFLGSPEIIAGVAALCADYDDLPVVAYMPDISWWDEDSIESYHDAFRELILPQTLVLAGNHSTLWRWLLPDWSAARPPTARDLARAAGEAGAPYTLVTGIPLPDQYIDNVLATPQTVETSAKYERFEATFAGAGDTLSAALAALLASGTDLPSAVTEALAYLDRCLDGGFRPGMGHVVPDRLFWAQSGIDSDTEGAPDGEPAILYPDVAPNDIRH